MRSCEYGGMMISSCLFQVGEKTLERFQTAGKGTPELKDSKNLLKKLQVNGEQAGRIIVDIFVFDLTYFVLLSNQFVLLHNYAIFW